MLGKFGYDDQLLSVLRAGHTPKDEHHTLLAALTCQCDTVTGQSPPQHTPGSALVLHKLQQGHFISHLALYTFIAPEQMPSIKKML